MITVSIFSEINKSIFVLPHEGTCTLWLYTCTCTVRKYFRTFVFYFRTKVLSYFRTFVHPYFRTFVLSYFRTFVLSYFISYAKYEGTNYVFPRSILHVSCYLFY